MGAWMPPALLWMAVGTATSEDSQSIGVHRLRRARPSQGPGGIRSPLTWPYGGES